MSRHVKAPFGRLSLHSKVLSILAFLALLALGNVLAMQLLLQRSDRIASSLNLAGKMRMLSQHITLDALAWQQNRLAGAHPAHSHDAEFSAAYRLLRQGGSYDGQPLPALHAQLQAPLQTLYTQWQEHQQALRQYQEAPHGDNAQLPALLHSNTQLLEQAEQLMSSIARYADQAQERARWSSLLLFAVDALVLLLIYLALVRRILQPMRAMVQMGREISAGNYSVRLTDLPSNELGKLGYTMNSSAAHIEQLLHDLTQEHAELAQTQAMFSGLAENSVAGIYMLNEAVEIIYVNEQMAQMFGYPATQLAARFPLRQLFPPEVYTLIHERVQERLQGQTQRARYERSALRADGSAMEVEIFGSATHYAGRPAIIGMMVDISERKRAEITSKRAALVYEHTTEAMVVTDARGVVQDINPAFTRITGYSAAEILGRRLNILNSGRQDRAFYQAMWASLHEHGNWSGDIHNRRKNGEEFIERLTITTSYNEDRSINCHIGLFNDVTEQRQREATIWHQAHYDALTQLPNRQMFQQNLLRAMEQSRHSGLPFALVFIDLDLFKEVNDTFGHDEGDELLRQVSQRLQACVRSSDRVARLGGDEFTLLLQDLKHTEDAHPICRKVLRAIAQPYALGNTTVNISASVGLTFFPRDGQDGVTLLKNADLAMYAAKDKGRNQFCEFAPAMQQEAQNRRLLLRDIQHGIDEQQFTLHYQPIVDMQSGRIVKAETLLRWNHPERGLVSPMDFIPMAEESGLIVPLGDWVLRQACAQLAQWRAQWAPDFELSVNVSPVQLHSSEQQAQAWLHYLDSLALPKQSLVIELTERVLLEADRESTLKLGDLQEAGIQLALDDFGTGYSSLSYLKRFDIDYLKIDRSFINQLGEDSEDNALCQAIIVMAHQLNICVIAEGVETQQQHDILQRAGCDFGQGYWYCKPIPAADFSARLQEQSALRS